ncbi:CRISPR-associated Cas1 family protein [Bisgaardia hudsonensis]|uniref:CRISPR-associated endonuclease Cas1 n=1 Tax=Bisgaardia hudsonensis TaxID=109472 RepID=A0A4R2N282_9PAST|nr:type II CRISPR-associated endonuclease Cas1 [Bisgaardia hudsonensis]QLB12428.1 subtype II CRISPR-associated endonuclease Cas1 [Bisgaardia hudsonensis]TCP13958.1 CRISPR-associated Cas1 family protein [Bisgaardia hudsonensis]
MSWRSLIISKPGKLSLRQQQLFIQQEVNEFTVPLEDIAVIVVESKEIIITAPLLSALGIYGITLLTCDEQFLPCGQWLPFSQYYRQLKTLKLQLEATKPQKKQLWQKIIQQKIRNQAFVLAQSKYPKESQKLLNMADRVKSGDKDNLEAQAAQIYFQTAFGADFRRWQENHINAHLNYAYTILRSAVARALVQYGWLPYLGLFHRSELNAFNLADDFIEPFRPLVDLQVWKLWQEGKISNGLQPKTKQSLVALLHYQMQFQGQTFTVLASIDRCVGSLQNAFINKNANLLKLPEMLPLKEHLYE